MPPPPRSPGRPAHARGHVGIAGCALLLTALSAYAGAPAVPAVAAPSFHPCEIRGSTGQNPLSAQCGRLSVPENPADPGGRHIELFVTRLPALAAEPAADAVTIVNGGPGASSVSLYADLQGAFAGLRRHRDIVVMDQRGTGRSAPLDCPTLEHTTYRFDADAIRAATRDCLGGLHQDPRFYTTSIAVLDLEALRRALGYDAWDLYGVSYGTRVAQHYLQRFPDSVRTLVIDGVVPPGLALGPDIPVNAQHTLDAILAECAHESACRNSYPDLDVRLESLSERLRREPVALDAADPLTGRPEPMELHYGELAMSLRLLSYAPETAALIPLVIEEAAARKNYQPLAAQALLIERSLTESISFGMHNSVVCTEDAPFYGDLAALWPKLEATYLGTDQVRALKTICEIWPHGVLDPSLRAPAPSSRPVLLLSGELDPITPPAYAERAARLYRNSLSLVAPGQGHGVVARGCLPLVVGDFVESGNLHDLDVSCVKRLDRDPFFVDLLGPPP